MQSILGAMQTLLQAMQSHLGLCIRIEAQNIDQNRQSFQTKGCAFDKRCVHKLLGTKHRLRGQNINYYAGN